MRYKLVAAGVAALMVLGGTVAYGAAASQDVACTITDNTLTCPLPAPPAPVTVTNTVTNTVTVTNTATATQTVTAAPTSSSTPTTPTSSTTTTSTSATTTTTAPPATGFPDATNTGVPAGTTLTAYTGPMTITAANTVIDAKTITGNLAVRAAGVKITRSKVNGNVDADNGGAVSITDSEVDGGKSDVAAITQDNVTLLRVNVHGSRQSITCGSNCSITDSWLHGQYLLPGSAWHVNGWISNGGSNVVLRHNTLACDVKSAGDGGCTGPAAAFPDFAVVKNITFDNNLFVANPTAAYCLYAGNEPSKAYGGKADNATGIVVTNNTFQRGTTGKCAYFGAATSFKSGASGNVWSGNKYDNGAVLNP